jgi:hypothetical protein
MSRNVLRYDRLIDDALRGVLKRVLTDAAADGLPGNHHFYITFKTTAEGVDIPDRLHARYPEEMTIVLQHQFWGLEIEDTLFRVTLSFDKLHERLTVPFAAVTMFADPSVQFGLQFQTPGGEGKSPASVPAAGDAQTNSSGEGHAKPGLPAAAAAETDTAMPQPEGRRVVALDAFRKK